jgi:deoxyribonucleoside regulator
LLFDPEDVMMTVLATGDEPLSDLAGMVTKRKSRSRSSAPRVSSEEQREHLMVQAAKLYYDLDRTQSEIAKQLGLTRWQVGRLLHEARELDVVRIDIAPRSPRRPDLESAVQRRFGLREAVVVPVTVENDGFILDAVAQAGARYLASLNPAPKTLGMSWGRTMAAMVRWMPHHWNHGLHVLVLNGGIGRTSSPNQPVDIAVRMAASADGFATIMPVPAILGLRSTKEALERDPTISGILEAAQRTPIACFTVGALSQRSVHVESGHLTTAEVAQLRRKGAVGDILGRFIDREGRIADEAINARTIGLDPKELRDKECSICVAGGKSKHAAVRAGLIARYYNVLVTDEQTATFLLRK